MQPPKRSEAEIAERILGATPVLPAPDSNAFNRIKSVFQHWMVRHVAGQAQRLIDAEPMRGAPGSHGPIDAIGTTDRAVTDTEIGTRELAVGMAPPRDYPLARAVVAAFCEALCAEAALGGGGAAEEHAGWPEPPPAYAAATRDASDRGTADAGAAAADLPAFPPHGAPTVRGSVPTPQRRSASLGGAADETERRLSEAAASALFVAEPDGTAAFDIVFKDEVLGGQLACRIELDPRSGIVATFSVADAATRRLVADRADVLRQRLAARGIEVSAVRVEVGEADRYGVVRDFLGAAAGDDDASR